MSTLSDQQANRLDGTPSNLSDYAGKVVLVVNVASKCGKTPQYEALQALYEKYGSQGFAVLGFPCNQFKGQEPGTSEEIAEFCSVNYGVTFPLFEKIDVNGEHTHAIYKWLKSETPGSDHADIEWNFVKFLVDRSGNPVKRYNQDFLPEDIASDIEALL